MAEGVQKNPGAFANLEKEIHHAFEQMAARVVAGLLAQATAPAEFARATVTNDQRFVSV